MSDISDIEQIEVQRRPHEIMFDLMIASRNSFPIKYESREIKDILWIIIWGVFFCFMLVLALILYNSEHYNRITMPSDSDGILCSIDQPDYPFIYFVNPPELGRVCVSECPKEGSTFLKCLSTTKYSCKFTQQEGHQVTYYQNQQTITINGKFCFPTNQTVHNLLIQNSDLEHRNSFMHELKKIVFYSVGALVLSFVYLLMVQLFPLVMNRFGIIVGGLALLGTGILLFFYPTDIIWLKVCLIIFTVLILLLIIMTICKNKDSWEMYGVFLKKSTQYISLKKRILLYIPLFFIILCLFMALIVLEYIAFLSSGHIWFEGQNKMYHNLSGFLPTFFTILLAIQAVWLFCLVKECFNFCVSGQIVALYYEKDHSLFYSLKLLFCKHFGSVIACAFMCGFFSIFDLIIDIIKPDQNAQRNLVYIQKYNLYCNCLIEFFGQVRSDSLALINLLGESYQYSAAYCQKICNASVILDYSQSTSRAYRLSINFLIAGIIFLVYSLEDGQLSIYASFLMMIITIFISTFFISVHCDSAEAIQVLHLNQVQIYSHFKEQRKKIRKQNYQKLSQIR